MKKARGSHNKKASTHSAEKSDEVSSPEQPVEMGVNEIVTSWYKDIHASIQAKTRRKEQFISNVVSANIAKVGPCSTHVEKDKKELRECIPLSSMGGGSEEHSEMFNEGRNRVDILEQLRKDNRSQGLESTRLNKEFHNRVHSLLKVIDRQEGEQREQISQMQQELWDENAAMETSLVKSEMKSQQKMS